MARDDQLSPLLRGSDLWNEWRRSNPAIGRADLSGADLSGANLDGTNLSEAAFDQQSWPILISQQLLGLITLNIAVRAV